MAPPAAPTNIRTFVQWKENTVHSGEPIECVITFKNVAKLPGQQEATAPHPNGSVKDKSRGYPPSAANSRRSSVAQQNGKPSHSRAASVASARNPSGGKGHRPALSLNVIAASGRGGLHSAPLQGRWPHNASGPGKGHGRALSIMSLGSEPVSEGRTPTNGPSGSKKHFKGHGRSASAQAFTNTSVPPRVLEGVGNGMPSDLLSPRQPSPLHEANTPPALPEALPLRPPKKRPGAVSANTTPDLGRQPSVRDGSFVPDFQFPPRPQQARKSPSPVRDRPRPARSPASMHSAQPSRSPRLEGYSGNSNANPLSRVISEASTSGTPRSSSEFYSMSNHSEETMASELPYQNKANGRLLSKPAHSRQPSSKQATPTGPETLMMGYAQTMGHFVVDGSLVNSAPFEDVKRKGVQGGGGVVGVERSKRNSGVFGGFSWGNIGESIGGLLGNDENSSMAQMKATVGSKTVPLLSTPQSLLFVDLRLAPGESRSYAYQFSLPRGLPPSHRGRAIKVSYYLAISIQRPEGQAVKTVEIPFRVLGSVDSRGEMLGHDLTSPYILLQDEARTKSIVPNDADSNSFTLSRPSDKSPNKSKPAAQGLEDFLRYTERLLAQPADSNPILLSPTSPTSPSLSRTQSYPDLTPTNSKQAIDYAILRSNRAANPTSTTSQTPNRFNIARNGQPIAVLTLLRPAYKLGETVQGTLDFTFKHLNTTTPTYAVNFSLETSETVDPSLALRSGSSIHRATRKVHALQRENTLFARQTAFALPIPANATPGFETTGVGLGWVLKVEFMVQRQQQQQQQQGSKSGVGNGQEDLLESLGQDERGRSYLARERLLAETFEISVPLRVYGAPSVEDVLAREGEGLEI
ncbi:hypothetical protein MBLNU230_g8366t1 [Neophaeotheca triangularis]